jgi:hypothetical protein
MFHCNPMHVLTLPVEDAEFIAALYEAGIRDVERR